MMKTRYPLILLLNIAGLALFLSWYLPAGHGIWSSLDTGVFRFFNQKLVESPQFLWIVAITNNRAFDGCSLLAMGALMLHFWLKETSEGRRRIIAIGLVLLHIPTKDASRDSFPGDHGMMLLIFSAFMLRYFGKVAGIIGLIIAVVFAFPRIMIGAHWLTDILIGSMTVVLIGLPWWLMTPLSDRLVTLFANYLPGKNKHFLNK